MGAHQKKLRKKKNEVVAKEGRKKKMKVATEGRLAGSFAFNPAEICLLISL